MPTLTAKRQDAVAARLHGIHDRLTKRLTAALRTFFRAQARRVVERYRAQHGIKAAGDVYATAAIGELLPATPGQDEDRELLLILEAYLAAMIISSSELVAPLVDGVALTPTDVGTRTILAELINQARGITETTRRAIRRHVERGARSGYTVDQVAYGLPDADYPSLARVVESTYANRAEAIATTETARVQSLSIAETYRMAGVERVLIRDGARCGWLYHDDPDKADGTVRTVAEYRVTPLAHPWCVRLGYPIVERKG